MTERLVFRLNAGVAGVHRGHKGSDRSVYVRLTHVRHMSAGLMLNLDARLRQDYPRLRWLLKKTLFELVNSLVWKYESSQLGV